MRPSFSFVLLALCFLAFVVMAIAGNVPYWTWFIPTGVGIMAVLTIFRGVYLPQKAVDRGMELIQSQDYNNRLVKVGEANADRIVMLFNSLIDKLRAERLQNREQESLLKLLIEASPMGVLMLDFNHKISLANLSFLKIFGINNLDDILGMNFKDMENDLIPEMSKVPLGESEIVRQGNFKIYRIYHLNFIQEGFKREFFLLESLTEEIMKAEKSAYEKVIRTISHEVNNTLGGVRSVLEIIAENTSDEDIRKVVESCNLRCESMSKFISEYADMVKLPQPVIKSIDLNLEIQRLIPFLERIIPENINFIFHPVADSLIINGDTALLQQVILNIVKNAVESISETGFVKLELSKTDNKILLVISNNGYPIKEEIVSQLFTPFFTTKTDGKGIGLTLVREVLNHHSAEYSLFTGKDGITRFNIFFPL